MVENVLVFGLQSVWIIDCNLAIWWIESIWKWLQQFRQMRNPVLTIKEKCWIGFNVNSKFENARWFEVQKFNYFELFNYFIWRERNVELKLKFSSDKWKKFFNSVIWIDFVKMIWIRRGNSPKKTITEIFSNLWMSNYTLAGACPQ